MTDSELRTCLAKLRPDLPGIATKLATLMETEAFRMMEEADAFGLPGVSLGFQLGTNDTMRLRVRLVIEEEFPDDDD